MSLVSGGLSAAREHPFEPCESALANGHAKHLGFRNVDNARILRRRRAACLEPCRPVARRVGEKWFVGGLNGLARRNFSIPLDFVGEGDLDVRIFMDADPALTGGLGKVAVSARRMKSGDVFSVDAAARGGFALIVEKAKTGQ